MLKPNECNTVKVYLMYAGVATCEDDVGDVAMVTVAELLRVL